MKDNDILATIQKIVKLTKENGNFSLEWNPQKSSYETVSKYLEGCPGYLDFTSEEEKQKAIKENSLVFLQWYPDTPVCFTTYAASNIKALFSYIDGKI